MARLRRVIPFPFLLLPFALLTAGCGGSVTTQVTTKPDRARTEDQLESARQALSGSPDRATCSTALQQLNAYFATHQDRRPAPLTDEQRKLLQDRFGLDAGEVAEVDSPTYTLLDAPHVEFCFLLRDAVRSLELEKLSRAEQAAAGFAWVMRQVMPHTSEGAIPPEFVLRRGWGSGPERAFAFVALLHQMGIPGCFVTHPNGTAPWACGALVEVGGEKQVLLFDHRLGLPLPGAKGSADDPLARAFRLALPVAGPDDGRQIATLAALRRQPDLLKPLTVDDKLPYDVGAEQVKDAVVRLAPPLSALSARMRALQNDLFSPKPDVLLAADPAELIRQFGSAAGVEGGADAVRGQAGAAGVLRRFLGPQDGGVDAEGRYQRAQLALVPRNALPRQVAQLEGDPGLWVQQFALGPFLSFQLEPRMPRDMVLRGQFKEAAGQLTSTLEDLRIQKDMLQTNPEVFAKFDAWKDELFKAYGDVGRAQEEARKGGSHEAVERALARREEVRKQGGKILAVLVLGGTAEPRGEQVTYQLALCMHEQAERLQARADQLAHANPPAEADEVKAARGAAQGAWKDAAGWWRSYLQKNPNGPASLQARLLHARARDALGQPDQVLHMLDAPADASPPQKAAWLYLARRLKAP